MNTATNSKGILTKHDLQQFETVIKEVLEEARNSGVQKEYMSLLERIVDALAELRLVVEFDHEQRLQAIEEYLQHNF